MPSRRGVETFKDFLQANRWIFKKEGIFGSIWCTGIMARCNAVPVRTLRSLQIPFEDQICRRCGRKPETEKNFHVGYEVRRQKDDGMSRRVDLIVIWRGRQKAAIPDPTVRLECGDLDAEAAFAEKRSIYDNVIPWFAHEYRLPLRSVVVHGLWFCARGVMHPATLRR